MAVAVGDLKLVKDVLKEGEPVNQIGPHGESPLQLAIQLGHKDIVEFLLKSKAIIPSDEEIATISNKDIRDLVKRYSDWKKDSRGFAEFAAAVAEPSMLRIRAPSTPSPASELSSPSPLARFPPELVGNIAAYLSPLGQYPKTPPPSAWDVKQKTGKGRRKRRTRKQTRRKNK